MIGIAGLGPIFANSSSFNPKSIAGLQLWLRSDLGVTQFVVGLVSDWADQSGHGHNLTQVGGAQPSYTTSNAAYGGKPSLAVDGTQWLTSTGAWNQAAPYTIYVAAKITNTGGTILGGGPPIIDGSGLAVFWDAADGNVFDATSAIAATTPAIVCAVYTDGGSIYVSNSQTAAGTSGAGAVITTNAPIFGANSDGGAGAAIGSATEFLIYSGAHNGATRQKVMKYMGGRYGLTAS